MGNVSRIYLSHQQHWERHAYGVDGEKNNFGLWHRCATSRWIQNEKATELVQKVWIEQQRDIGKDDQSSSILLSGVLLKPQETNCKLYAIIKMSSLLIFWAIRYYFRTFISTKTPSQYYNAMLYTLYKEVNNVAFYTLFSNLTWLPLGIWWNRWNIAHFTLTKTLSCYEKLAISATQKIVFHSQFLCALVICLFADTPR